MAETANDVAVLIVGGGPTGMMLSLWLTKFNVQHRIVDKAASVGTTSRALVMHARSLEYYRQLGLSDTLVEHGTRVGDLVIYHSSERYGAFKMSTAGVGLSKFPFVLSITQDEHEDVLDRALAKRGIKVERNTELIAMNQTESGVAVTLSVDQQQTELTASYVIGCDGAHSAVRHLTGITMPGGTYDRAFFVADVIHNGPPSTQGQMNVCLSHEDFCIIIPMPHQAGRARIIGFVPRDVEAARPEHVSFDDVRATVERNAKDLAVSKVNWFARYKIHHRVAEHFQKNRVFLCGDAAHIHSPVGGQGMNTGLGDVSNLAWKLASVLNHGAPNSLLATYALERKPFAHTLVNTTDTMFTRISGDSYLSIFLRNIMMPYIMPRIVRWLGLAPLIFRRISQILVSYRDSPLSTRASCTKLSASLQAGDRLPWTEYLGDDNVGLDNHAMLERPTWQGHVYGTPAAWIAKGCQERKVIVNAFPWNAAMAGRGLERDVLYLIRPDGYIGFVTAAKNEEEDGNELSAYMQRWNVGRMD